MDKEKFDAMLALAEFGATRMERRGSTEFQIFISYITLIVLGLYVIITNHDKVDNIFINASATILCISLVLINFIYIFWQVGLSRAMENDATRRNYYVKISQELIGHYPVVDWRGKNKEVEYIIVVNGHYFHQFYDLHLMWKHWSRLLLVGIPTILHIILMFEISDLTNYPICFCVISIIIPAGLIAAGIIMACFK